MDQWKLPSLGFLQNYDLKLLASTFHFHVRFNKDRFIWYWPADKSYEAGFYKPTVPKGLQHIQQCQVGWNFPLILFVPRVDPNKWCMKHGLLIVGFENKTFWLWVLYLNVYSSYSPKKILLLFIFVNNLPYFIPFLQRFSKNLTEWLLKIFWNSMKKTSKFKFPKRF